MKLLTDMNLSALWVKVFEQEGWQALHWSTVGDPRAEDSEIMNWVHDNSYIVFTHDLDLGILLALTRAVGPRVIQVRTQNVMPGYIGKVVVETLRQYESLLESGALIKVDEGKSRIRILPF